MMSKFEVMVVDPKLYEWVLLHLHFNTLLMNSDFAFSSTEKSFLTAVSFNTRLEVLKNESSLFNFTLSTWSRVVRFSPSGEELYFVAQEQREGFSRNLLYKLDVRTLQLDSLWESEMEINDLAFVPKEGFQHLFATSGHNWLGLWDNDTLIEEMETPLSYDFIKFTEDGDFLLGVGDKHFGNVPTDLQNYNESVPFINPNSSHELYNVKT